MKYESRKFLEKAERALAAAEILYDNGDTEFAAGRAYYAMLHVAQALLCQNDLKYRKHSGVHSAYGEHFAKTGVLDPKFHRWMLDAFDRRLKGDYDVEMDIDAETVTIMLEQAREFLMVAKRYLETSTD